MKIVKNSLLVTADTSKHDNSILSNYEYGRDYSGFVTGDVVSIVGTSISLN